MSTISAGTTLTTALVQTGDTTGELVIKTNGGSTTAMTLTTAGNVGIGTSSPATTLHVSATSPIIQLTDTDTGANSIISAASSGGALQLGADENNTVASSYMAFRVDGSERMRIDSSGNLGLGVTPSAWGSTYTAIQMPNGVSLASYDATVDPIMWLGANAYYDGTSNKYVVNDYASLYIQNNGQHQWQIAPSGTAGNAITFTQAMTLDASGNLGVGTTSPANRLHVKGTWVSNEGIFQIDADSGTQFSGMYLQNNGTPKLAFFHDNTNSFASINCVAADALVFGTNNTERMRIDSSGNVGIGTIPGSYGKFTIYNNVSSLYHQISNITRPSSTTPALFMGTNGATNDAAIASNNSVLYLGYDVSGSFTAVASVDTSNNFKFNSGYGSVATAYGCRAWVNFNGTGTPAIRGDGNITSITDNGTGDYTLNFTTAMPDVNYSLVASSTVLSSQTQARSAGLYVTADSGTGATITTSAVRVAYRSASNVDSAYLFFAVFR